MNMSRNIFEDLQSPFPSAPAADTGEAVPSSAGIGGPSGEAPPPYSTLPATAADFNPVPWAGPGAVTGHGYGLVGMKLAYMDFMPRLVRKRVIGKDEYESFTTLLQRANTWLEEHANLQLISCETVTWFGASQKEIFSDSTIFRRISGVTTYMRGIRFWYLTKLIPSPSRGAQGVQVVHCLTIPARVSENISQLVKRVNDRITESSNIGKILSVETIRLDCYDDGMVNTESTIWKEDSSDTKKILFALRVYSIWQVSSAHETIGFQDFIPDKTIRSKDNRGYELFSDVMDRAGQWIAQQRGVRFTNVQTVPIKIKKQLAFEERCSFTEHGRRPTPYLHIIRAYFVIQKTPASNPVDIQSTRLTYKTFSPMQIAAATGNTPAKFEDVRTLLDRIYHWLQITGAHLFSIETLPVRVSAITSQLGSNATFVPNQDGSSSMARFLYHIRIYLNGDYVEPPPASALVF